METDIRIRHVQIPTIGDEMTLAEDWSFRLFNEYRNEQLIRTFLTPEQHEACTMRSHTHWEYQGPGKPSKKVETPASKPYFVLKHDVWTDQVVTLPAGTVLKVSRIYIRNGASDFDSLTFTASIPGKKGKPRFWAKLADVNRMVVRSVAWEERDVEAEAAVTRKITLA